MTTYIETFRIGIGKGEHGGTRWNKYVDGICILSFIEVYWNGREEGNIWKLFYSIKKIREQVESPIRHIFEFQLHTAVDLQNDTTMDIRQMSIGLEGDNLVLRGAIFVFEETREEIIRSLDVCLEMWGYRLPEIVIHPPIPYLLHAGL